MKQLRLFKNKNQKRNFSKACVIAHGGAHSLNKRRSKRPLDIKKSLHVTLRSKYAYGKRSLLKNKDIVNAIIYKAAKLFNVKVYEKAICTNHIHLLIRGKERENIQNFFRVVAGHIAQEILKSFPIIESDLCKTKNVDVAWGGAPLKSRKKASREEQKASPCKKNQRKFWDLLIYSRIVTWGREFSTVTNYLVQNVLEALNIIAYQPRKTNKMSLFKKHNTS